MASITLDFRAGQITEPLDPDMDDLGRANVITAKRRTGSQATASLDTGPRGTAAIGRNPKDVETNPASDADLPQHAAYHVARATEAGPRYPKITVDLNANPSLTAAVAALDVGDRASLATLPPELGWPEADTLILGYQEIIGTHSRRFIFNSTRGGILSHAGVLDGGASACLQTAGAELPAAITDVQTSFLVATASGPLFTLTPPAGARIIVRDREVMPVSSIASALTDPFTRSVSPGWGAATSGQTWSCSPNTQFQATGTKGFIGVNAVDTLFTGSIADIGATVDAVVYCEPNAVAAGDFFDQRVKVRHGGSEHIEVVLRYKTTGQVDVIVQTQAAVLSALANFLTYSAASVFGVHVQAAGSTVRHRVWDTAGSEPANVWHATVTTSVLGSPTDAFSLVAVRATANSQAGLGVEFDNVEVFNPQRFTVTRDTDRRMANPEGGDVRVYRPLRLTL